MDAGRKSTRKFPSYTLAQLKQVVVQGPTDWNSAANLELIKQEIAAREAGTSKPVSVPQITWR